MENNKIVLIQNWFNSKSRHSEYIEALRVNDSNEHIDEIILLCNDRHPDLDTLSPKVKFKTVQRQPTYVEYFKFLNKKYKNYTCILSNLDMTYDESILKVHDYVDKSTVIALARYDLNNDGGYFLRENSYSSQDTWIFNAPLNITDINAEFTLGVAGCDHRIVYELNKHHTVINPCHEIKSYHIHTSQIRSWANGPVLPRSDGYGVAYPSGTQFITYTMFTPNLNKQQHRDWDKCFSLDRYWYNIPAIVAVYKTLLPNFKIKIHISKGISNHRLYPLLQELEGMDLLILKMHDEEYSSMEPTLWRYEDIFDTTKTTVFTRDLDSLPTSSEMSANLYFINNHHQVSTIRSHSNHDTPSTIMLAGLSSFKPMTLKHPTDYNKFYNHYKGGTWGLDQSAIIDYTICVLKTNCMNFVDIMISNAKHTVNPSSHIKSLALRPVELLEYDPSYAKHNNLLNILDDITVWSGEPVDVRGNALLGILNNTGTIGNTIKTLLENNEYGNFYNMGEK